MSRPTRMLRTTVALLAAPLVAIAGCQAQALAPAPATPADAPPSRPEGLPAPRPAEPPAVMPEIGPPVERPTPPRLAISKREFAPDELIVALESGFTAKAFMALPQAAGLKLLRDSDFDGTHLLTVRVESPAALQARFTKLAALDVVTRVSFNTYARPHAAPNDPRYGEQWSHLPEFANTQTAWDKLAGVDQSKVIVAVIDSGIDPTHEEFKVNVTGDRLIGARNVTPKPEAVSGTEEDWAKFTEDDLGHGTITAGLIGATGNNGKGMAGVAWGVRILPIKADSFGDDGATTFKLADILEGMRYAATFADAGGAKVRVVNMSLGEESGRVSPLYNDAVQFCKRKGILVVASTGNQGSPAIASPANTPGVLAVGSTSRHLDYEFVSHFSNYGQRLDLVAPGGGVLVTLPTKPSQAGSRGGITATTYGYASGTSEAAPYVAGVAALVFAKYDAGNAKATPPEVAIGFVDAVRTHLLRACDDRGAPGWDPSWGYGRLNADLAVGASALLTKDPTDTRPLN